MTNMPAAIGLAPKLNSGLNQEQSLSKFIQLAISAPILSAEEERSLATSYRQDQDLEAARQLVVSHMRHVISVARGFAGYGLPLADLIQEGNIGLMKAVKNFDPDRGVRLVSFAVHWVKAEIYDYVIRNWKIVKVATTKAQRKLFFNLRKSRKKLAWMTEQETQDLAKNLDVPVKTVREMESRLSTPDVAFDAPGSDDDELTPSPSGYLPDMRFNPEMLLLESDQVSHRENALSEAISKLDDRSREIVTRRWLNDDKATLHELAAEFSVSAERIRQIEKRAMDTMKGTMDL
ncbi:MAG TPA: RNA polymerase sigma factor RpoH [Gammaproteobacteria bacterium]|nr:RNA polymerase sigma factor RpoH [Gammaproteobacteria bacterium]